jgi:hypothetical protein
MKRIAILIISWALAACGGGSSDSTSAIDTPPAVTVTEPAFNMAQTISDGAQSTTMAFSGLAPGARDLTRARGRYAP